MKLLLHNGANMNTQDKQGQTPLLQAAGESNEAIVKLLLENGANVNVKDNYDKTLLLHEIVRKYYQQFSFLTKPTSF